MKRFLAMLALVLHLAAPAGAQQTKGVFVANQGNFSESNGSVTFYDPATGQASEVLEDFGTIVQSVGVAGQRAYVVSNTGGRIDILEAATGERLAPITGLMNPRYLAFVNEDQALLTNQVFRFGGVTDKSYVSFLDLRGGVVVDTVQVPGQPDHLVLVGNRAYVALGFFGETSLVGVIDVEARELVQTIDVGCVAPRYLVADKEGEVHVVCNGSVDFTTGAVTPGALVTLNGATGAEVGRIEATTLLAPSGAAIATGQDATYSATLQHAYIIAGAAILVLDTATNTLTDTLAVQGADLIGGLAFDDAAGRLYVTRYAPGAEGFTTSGRVEIYDPATGLLDSSFDAAIAPVHVAFDQEGLVTAAEPVAEAPTRFGLLPAYPNPFNPTTTLPFEIARPGRAHLALYDALGREVAVLVEASLTPGYYEARWDAGGLPSGLYLARLEAAGHVSTRRLVLLK